MASPPFSVSSPPTCGPTNSTRRICTWQSIIFPSAVVHCCRLPCTPSARVSPTALLSAPTTSLLCSEAALPVRTGSRTRISREVPKYWTMASSIPASPRTVRTVTGLADSAYSISTKVPPVKSIPKLRPRRPKDPRLATSSTIDNTQAPRRLPRKSNWVTCLKIRIAFAVRLPTV